MYTLGAVIYLLNSLLHIGHYGVRMSKISNLKKGGIIKKIKNSHERRCLSKTDEKRTRATNG